MSEEAYFPPKPEQKKSTSPDPESDPKLAAVYEKLSLQIVGFHASSQDPHDILHDHLDHHTQEMLELLCLWARSLIMIDRGGRISGNSLLQHFMDRLDRQLSTDFKAANKQNVFLPENQILNLFALDTIDLAILWILVAFEIDPGFKGALAYSMEKDSPVVISPAVMMRFLCETPKMRQEILWRLSPSGRLCSRHLIIRLESGNSPLYHELHPSEQLVNMFSNVLSLSAVTTRYAELQFPHFSEETFISASHQKTYDIIHHFVRRPPLQEQPNLERENLNFVPSLSFLVEGLPGTGRCTLIKWISSHLGMPVIVVQGGALTHSPADELGAYLESLFNDAWMLHACICIRDAGPLVTDD